jgi:hypothetical protein
MEIRSAPEPKALGGKLMYGGGVTGLVVLVVVGTSIWVLVDAPTWGLSRWNALATLLLWIVCFPLYLADRTRAKREMEGGSPLPTAASTPVWERRSLPTDAMPPPVSTAPSSWPPGWYADPWHQSAERFWDGFTWSERVR